MRKLILNGVKAELYEKEINIILTALELYSLNLNSIWKIPKDKFDTSLEVCNIQHLYDYLNKLKIKNCK